MCTRSPLLYNKPSENVVVYKYYKLRIIYLKCSGPEYLGFLKDIWNICTYIMRYGDETQLYTGNSFMFPLYLWHMAWRKFYIIFLGGLCFCYHPSMRSGWHHVDTWKVLHFGAFWVSDFHIRNAPLYFVLFVWSRAIEKALQEGVSAPCGVSGGWWSHLRRDFSIHVSSAFVLLTPLSPSMERNVFQSLFLLLAFLTAWWTQSSDTSFVTAGLQWAVRWELPET